MIEFFNVFWNYILASAPYLILGFFVGGLIHSFVPLSLITKWLGQNNVWSVVKASLIGIPLPLCSCAVIPTAMTLRKKGAGTGPTSSFLISTPESGVDSIVMTYGLMDLPMTLFRPIIAFVTATFAGIGQILFNKNFDYVSEEKKSCCHKSSGNNTEEKLNITMKIKKALRYGFVDLVNDLSFWLSIGLLVGALIQFFIPTEFFEQLDPNLSKIIVLFIGVPFYICASATTPIAASLVLKGMSPGTALILLLTGPATNISNLLVIQKAIGKKGIFINIFVIAIVSLLSGFLLDYLYTRFSWPLDYKLQEHIHEENSVFQNILGILLLLLVAKGLYQTKLKRFFK